jgi:Na+/H+ antiporter NhaC
MNLFWWSNKINSQGIVLSIKEGFLLMKDSLVVLLLAWTLTSFMKMDLGSGTFLAKILMPLLNQNMLPLSVFLICSTIAFSIGSSWATMAVIIPIIIPMLPVFAKLSTPVNPDNILIVFPTIGAIISGAIFGASLSPIADLLVLTSKNTHTNHFAYVKAQIQYLIPIAAGSCLSFALAGMLSNMLTYWQLLFASAIPGFLLTIAIITLLSKLQKHYAYSN